MVKKIVYDRWLTCVALIAMLGICHFCVCITIAMRSYQGQNGESYQFTEQYLSDLGTRHSNVRKHFNWGIIALGLSLIPFFMTVPDSDNEDSVWLKLIGLAGAVSALGLTGLGIFPADYSLRHLHRVALAMWAIPMPLVIFSFLAAVSKSKARAVFLLYLVVALCMVATLVSFFFLGKNFVLQKLAVAISLMWFPLVAWFVVRSAIRTIVIQRTMEEDANEYITAITNKQR